MYFYNYYNILCIMPPCKLQTNLPNEILLLIYHHLFMSYKQDHYLKFKNTLQIINTISIIAESYKIRRRNYNIKYSTDTLKKYTMISKKLKWKLFHMNESLYNEPLYQM